MVCYGLNKNINPEHNMDARLNFLKEMLSSFPCDPSPNLRNFAELQGVVNEAKENQDYTERFIKEQEEHIKGLEKSIRQTEMTCIGAVTTGITASVTGLVLAPFTFGIPALLVASIGGASVVTYSSHEFSLHSKREELENAKRMTDKRCLNAAVEEYNSQCDYFEKLENALKDE